MNLHDLQGLQKPMKTWTPEDHNDGPDLTPMIDVVFLLIVFFMTVATIINAERIEIDLPIAGESKVPEDAGRRENVTLLADGTLFAGIRRLNSADELGLILRHGVENIPGFKVNLRVDARTHHRHVREVMKTCAENGCFQIIFSAYQTN